MVTEWHGEDPPIRGKSEIFKPAPEVPKLREYVYRSADHKEFLIVRDPLAGLNTCEGDADEKGWPLLSAADDLDA